MASETSPQTQDETPTVATSIKAPPAPPAPAEEAARRLALLPLSLLALAVGIITGFGAVVFRDLIGLIHNLFFLRQVSFAYDSSLFTPFNPWGPAIILVPVIGGIGVTWEHDLHLYLRRVTLYRSMLGTPEDHDLRVYSITEALTEELESAS